jgi:MFS family permease
MSSTEAASSIETIQLPRAERRLSDGITMFVVTALSLLLLAYVGAGEGRRTYENLEIDKLTSQGKSLQAVIENNLRAGLPLRQIVGFTTMAEGVVSGIDEVHGITVYDRSGQTVFVARDKRNFELPAPPDAIKRIKDKTEVDKSDTHLQIVLPLNSRFETVGSIVITASRLGLIERLRASFQPLIFIVLAISAAFAVVVWAATPYFARTRTPWLQIGYALTFLGTAGAVVTSLVSLYTDGIEGKLHASAATLAQRLSDVVEFKLKFDDIDGIDQVFQNYRKLNPEIAEVDLVINDKITISSDSRLIGKSWASNSANFEYKIDISQNNSSGRVYLVVSAPTRVVYTQVERSVRNFAALFVASAFLAGLFLQVASSMQKLRPTAGAKGQTASAADEAGLIIVKPLFFLAVFLEHLLYSFLPKFMQDIATHSGVSVAYAAAPFTAYYLCFALSLIPAGQVAEKRGPRILIWIGLLLAAASVFGLLLPLNIYEVTALRGIAGIGQGMLFIGIQAYILAVASPEKKTQGAAIIVFGFQGGMISGMAIGSLLVSYLGPHGVFTVAGVIGLTAAGYCLMLVPKVSERSEAKPSSNFSILQGLARVMRSGEFLKTMLCIGVPAKAILTGAITFALPLLLGQYGYRSEDIGQVIMLYAMSVVAASGVISRLVDKTGNTTSILFMGAALSGGGLVLIGTMGSPAIGDGVLSWLLVIAGVICVGLAHGFINAPVVTHVAHSELAKSIGANPVTTTYRFVERIGHVAGPALVAQLFLFWGQTPQILTGLGIGTVVLGFLFLIRKPTRRVEALGPEAAR